MAIDTRPGLDSRRLVALMQGVIARLGLDLRGRTVLTEAATGAYAVTPVLAALAGAQVWALGNASPHASASEVAAATLQLARSAGVVHRVDIVRDTSPDLLSRVDIVTNSGQVRPIDAAMISALRPSCVVPLMYESWEYRSSDLDLEACRDRGMLVAGTNERHPDVDVFSFLGPLALHHLHSAGLAVRGCRIIVLSDNEFAPFILAGLECCGADVVLARRLTPEVLDPVPDAVVVAMTPRAQPVLTSAEARMLAEGAPGTVIAQFWGDIDRARLSQLQVPIWPPRAPAAGHMAVLLSDIGPDAVVRLQAAGLKVGEVLARGLDKASDSERSLVQLM
ncbi:hypothetical protein ACOCJ4_03795 [Knoellia sp. CPCC 206435]|uniref:hypothetical protein n=1 Tax=Knoellia terrae TaxID=3404797 RepID=UPI003B42CDDF